MDIFNVIQILLFLIDIEIVAVATLLEIENNLEQCMWIIQSNRIKNTNSRYGGLKKSLSNQNHFFLIYSLQ